LRVVPSTAGVRSDSALLRRILQNFLSNALRYTAKGRVLVGCRRRGGNLRIEVWDTGPGIPQEHLGDIFMEFQRLAPRSDETEGGSGSVWRSSTGSPGCSTIPLPYIRGLGMAALSR